MASPMPLRRLVVDDTDLLVAERVLQVVGDGCPVPSLPRPRKNVAPLVLRSTRVAEAVVAVRPTWLNKPPVESVSQRTPDRSAR